MTKLTMELLEETFAVFNQSPDEFAESLKTAALSKWFVDHKNQVGLWVIKQ